MANANDVKKLNLFSLLTREGLVSYENGTINWEATLAGVRVRVSAEAEEALAWDEQILFALNKVFDSLPVGQRIPEPMAVNLVERELYQGSDISEMAVIRGKITDYLDRSIVFTGKRGRGGGLGRA